MENKSKFGLGVGLMGALVYLIGGSDAIGLLILFVAIALWEENEFVKVSIRRVAVLYLGYTIVEQAIHLIVRFINVLPFDKVPVVSSVLRFISSALTTISTIVAIAYGVLIIILALKALIKPVVEPSILDNMVVDKVTQAVSSVASSVAAQTSKKPAAKTCPSCGAPMAEGTAFCTKCGAKVEEAPAAPAENN